jgi:lipid-A-disaccharide synthase-like uncharacterized protein
VGPLANWHSETHVIVVFLRGELMALLCSLSFVVPFLKKKKKKKFHAHLAGWKMNVLSPAGRLTLLKSSLSSIPVYYMSCYHLPVHTINKLTSLLRKFFWGKLDKKRYLAFIAWDKICLPYEEGA